MCAIKLIHNNRAASENICTCSWQRTLPMASAVKSLIEDDRRYLKAFKLFLQRSTEHQSMQDFIHNVLPDILGR